MRSMMLLSKWRSRVAPDFQTGTFVASRYTAKVQDGVSEMESEVWEKTVRRDLAVGRTVGEYVIRRRIGEGGMGIVYEAEHPQIGRRVAIKIIRPDREVTRDLLGEARAVSLIR